jgi:hypothetical protein
VLRLSFEAAWLNLAAILTDAEPFRISSLPATVIDSDVIPLAEIDFP